MLGRGVMEVIRRSGAAYPLAPLARMTSGADAFLVNLECALTSREQMFPGARKAFYFRADPAAVETLTSAGVDLVTLANNHALDAGYDGLTDTLSVLRNHGIRYVGAGERLDEASSAVCWSVRGASLGIVAYCDHQRDFAARVDRPGIRFAVLRRSEDVEIISREVASLRENADYGLVALHWQPNWVADVAPWTRRLARDIVDAGAHVVWGHSPHHFQGVEWMGAAVVLYSTGDLVDDYAVVPRFRNDRQLLFDVTLGRGVESVRALPLALDVGRTRPAGGEDRAWIVRRFTKMCRRLGSRVEDSGRWLEILPD